MANEELHILKPEGIVVIVGVFPKSQKKEEGNDDHVCNGLDLL